MASFKKCVNKNVPHPERIKRHFVKVRSSLDKQLGNFLRKKRGNETFSKFSKRIGVGKGTLFRLERGEQSITLSRLNEIIKRLKCSLRDIFPDKFC